MAVHDGRGSFGQTGERVDVIHRSGLGQRGNGSPVLCTGVVTREEDILAAVGVGRCMRPTVLLSISTRILVRQRRGHHGVLRCGGTAGAVMTQPAVNAGKGRDVEFLVRRIAVGRIAARIYPFGTLATPTGSIGWAGTGEGDARG